MEVRKVRGWSERERRDERISEWQGHRRGTKVILSNGRSNSSWLFYDWVEQKVM